MDIELRDVEVQELVFLPSLVERIMFVEQIIWGGKEAGYVVQFVGRLAEESSTAFDKLSAWVEPYDLSVYFRMVEKKHAVILRKETKNFKKSNPWINIILLVLTFMSVLLAGALYSGDFSTSPTIPDILSQLWKGWPFTVSLMSILLAHEFGHFFAAKLHNTPVTLPYFIPFPASPLGTMGAFINLKGTPKNKRHLLDIGIAGPIAGLIVAIPVTILGLYLSEVSYIPLVLPEGQIFEGNSILYLTLKYLVFGEWLPKPGSFGGLPPFLYWIKYFFTGSPIPLGGVDVMLSPVAWAGWAGLLVTGLNLIPAGQLDGGHVMYVLFGRRIEKWIPVILAILVLLGFVWSGWWLWAFIIFWFGGSHAVPQDDITELDPLRKRIAIAGLVIAILVFMPVPLVANF